MHFSQWQQGWTVETPVVRDNLGEFCRKQITNAPSLSQVCKRKMHTLLQWNELCINQPTVPLKSNVPSSLSYLETNSHLKFLHIPCHCYDQHSSLIPIYTLKIKPGCSNGQIICKLVPVCITIYWYSWFFKSERLTYHASCQLASGS